MDGLEREYLNIALPCRLAAKGFRYRHGLDMLAVALVQMANHHCEAFKVLLSGIHYGNCFGMILREITLRFDDEELADSLVSASPPAEFTVAKQMILHRSEDAVAVFRVVIQLAHSVSIDAELTIPKALCLAIAGWLGAQLKKKIQNRKNKKANMNGDVISLSKKKILGVIRKEITARIARDKQRSKYQQKENSRRLDEGK